MYVKTKNLDSLAYLLKTSNVTLVTKVLLHGRNVQDRTV